MLQTGLQFRPKFPQVVVQNDTNGVRTVAMHVDQRVEAAFRTTEQPVDGPLFIEFDVVTVEFLEEVVADSLPLLPGQVVGIKGVFQKREILFVVLGAESDFEKLFEAFADIVGEPVAIEQRNDVVFIGYKGRIGNLTAIVVHRFALIGKDKSRFVQRVATQHAAHRVADELPHRVSRQ